MADRSDISPTQRFELNDAPVARLARTASLVVVLCVALLIGWMVVTPVDEIVRARGEVQPESSTQRLQSEYGGAVGAVHVALGDAVEVGQLIVEFDAAELFRNCARRGAVLSRWLWKASAFMRWSMEGLRISPRSGRGRSIPTSRPCRRFPRRVNWACPKTTWTRQ